jgi:hypothetical protein
MSKVILSANAVIFLHTKTLQFLDEQENSFRCTYFASFPYAISGKLLLSVTTIFYLVALQS